MSCSVQPTPKGCEYQEVGTIGGCSEADSLGLGDAPGTCIFNKHLQCPRGGCCTLAQKQRSAIGLAAPSPAASILLSDPLPLISSFSGQPDGRQCVRMGSGWWTGSALHLLVTKPVYTSVRLIFSEGLGWVSKHFLQNTLLQKGTEVS